MNTPQKIEGYMNKTRSNPDTTLAPKRMANLCQVKEYRCPVCKRLLMKGKIIVIETRCPKCKKILTLNDTG